jgi:hypothetical protein
MTPRHAVKIAIGLGTIARWNFPIVCLKDRRAAIVAETSVLKIILPQISNLIP